MGPNRLVAKVITLVVVIGVQPEGGKTGAVCRRLLPIGGIVDLLAPKDPEHISDSQCAVDIPLSAPVPLTEAQARARVPLIDQLLHARDQLDGRRNPRLVRVGWIPQRARAA